MIQTSITIKPKEEVIELKCPVCFTSGTYSIDDDGSAFCSYCLTCLYIHKEEIEYEITCDICKTKVRKDIDYCFTLFCPSCKNELPNIYRLLSAPKFRVYYYKFESV